jgi:hypothetical protein
LLLHAVLPRGLAIARRRGGASNGSDGTLIGVDSETFESRVNRLGFLFFHDLNVHPLFQLDSLIELARRTTAPQNYWSNGTVSIADPRAAKTEHSTSLHDTLMNIEINDSLVVLKSMEQGEMYRPILRRLFETIGRVCGPHFRQDVEKSRGTLLIASPRRITSYHIDADANFLFQIRGGKELQLYDMPDRRLLPADQIERFFSGDINGAVFAPPRQHEAKRYTLQAAWGVHIPPLTPHWAQVQDGISIALSVNFDLHSVRRTSSIYRINHGLRRLGLSPREPGSSRWRDDFKLGAKELLRRLRQSARMSE